MKTINLYFDFEFTSLSPDAQPISLGIVSDGNCVFPAKNPCGNKFDVKDLDWCKKGDKTWCSSFREYESFYAEFTDFDINRCDDWVKENVVGKLHMKKGAYKITLNDWNIKAPTSHIVKHLTGWLEQFKNHQIQFVCDCGTFDWYWMLQLIGKWKEYDNQGCPRCDFEDQFKVGLPQLPDNISPVPQDLNDLIAVKKGISVREAFDLDREVLASKLNPQFFVDTYFYIKGVKNSPKNPENKHNAFWDAKVIKEIYNKIK